MSDKLNVLTAHGVEFTSESGDERIGTCPFTGKVNKFYYNVRKCVWDSKTAGLSGTVPQFLEQIHNVYVEQMTKTLLRKLSENRRLPDEAFAPWKIGWTGSQYSFLIRDAGGQPQDIRLYTLGKRVMSTKGVETGLLGAEQIPMHPTDPIYLCEGEWDAVALRWLMKKVGARGIVVGLPGAGVFKGEWTPWFSGRRVHTLYDYDAAGEEGELRLEKRLKSVCQTLTFVHWPDGVSDGFDVRDYIIYGAIDNHTPKECWEALHRKFQPYTRHAPPKNTTGNVAGSNGHLGGVAARVSAWTQKTPSYDDLTGVFKKWLYLENTVGIELMCAVVASQEIEGPPVWMFLVAPPGGAKTEILSSLIGMDQIYLQSSLTPHALVSGANWKGDQDPSLIPRLNGKVLVIKDFTSILSMRDNEKDEIFGILRDAYDGRCGKVFGTGIERSYESRFTVLAAVTPRIYDLSQQHHSLGERFLKCGVGNNLQHSSERDIIRRAIDNIDRDTQMKAELQDVVHAFMKRTRSRKLPTLSDVMYERIIALAMFGARMRGTVSRDQYHHDVITSRPSAEIGSRLGIQLAKLGKSIAWIHGRKEVTDSDYNLVKKVMLDTISQRTEDVVRVILQECPTVNDVVDSKEISGLTRYPPTTVSRILEDLHILEVVECTGTKYRYYWTLSKYIRDQIEQAQLYRTDAELKRPTTQWVRVSPGRGRGRKFVIKAVKPKPRP